MFDGRQEKRFEHLADRNLKNLTTKGFFDLVQPFEFDLSLEELGPRILE